MQYQKEFTRSQQQDRECTLLHTPLEQGDRKRNAVEICSNQPNFGYIVFINFVEHGLAKTKQSFILFVPFMRFSDFSVTLLEH